MNKINLTWVAIDARPFITSVNICMLSKKFVKKKSPQLVAKDLSFGLMIKTSDFANTTKDQSSSIQDIARQLTYYLQVQHKPVMHLPSSL